MDGASQTTMFESLMVVGALVLATGLCLLPIVGQLL